MRFLPPLAFPVSSQDSMSSSAGRRSFPLRAASFLFRIRVYQAYLGPGAPSRLWKWNSFHRPVPGPVSGGINPSCTVDSFPLPIHEKLSNLFCSRSCSRPIVLSRGCFNSGMRSLRGDVAQLGERYVRNVQVVGSNPIISTNIISRALILWISGTILQPPFLGRSGNKAHAMPKDGAPHLPLPSPWY